MDIIFFSCAPLKFGIEKVHDHHNYFTAYQISEILKKWRRNKLYSISYYIISFLGLFLK